MPRPAPRLLACAFALLLLTAMAWAALDPLGPVEPSAQEQLGIYELNLARHDPEAYGDRIGADLSGIARQPPLALNLSLTGSARYHAQELRIYDYWDHVSPITGKAANQMAVDHGYDLFGLGLGHDWGADNTIEALAYGLNQAPDFDDAVAGLIVDEGVPGLSHRRHLLAMDAWFESYVEVGCGRSAVEPERYYAIHTAWRNLTDRYLTGVVYADANRNGRFDLDEGVPGATVQAGTYSTRSLGAGGYALLVPDGDYTVTCGGGAFAGAAAADVTVAGDNVAVDFRSGLPVGVVDFSHLEPPVDLAIGLTAAPALGPAPLTVDFTAASPAEYPVYAWDFGDGNSAAGAAVAHGFVSPGLYPVTVDAAALEGYGTALTVVGVSGPDGAGPGTTPPGSASLTVLAVKVKTKLAKPGRDQLKLTGTIEMPAGFVPGSHPVRVCLAGVSAEFLLGAKNKAAGPGGSKLALKVKKVKGGGGLPPGRVATVKITLKGDLAATLRTVGLRDVTGAGTLEDVPFALMIGEQPYLGSTDLSWRAKVGKGTTAQR